MEKVLIDGMDFRLQLFLLIDHAWGWGKGQDLRCQVDNFLIGLGVLDGLKGKLRLDAMVELGEEGLDVLISEDPWGKIKEMCGENSVEAVSVVNDVHLNSFWVIIIASNQQTTDFAF